MRRLAGTLAVLLAAAAATADEPASPGVSIDAIDHHLRISVRLPGALAGYALPRRADGSRRLVMLTVAPETDDRITACATPATRELWELVGSELIPLRVPVPAGVGTLDALDLDGDGDEELLLSGDGELWSLGPEDDAPVLAAADETLALQYLEPQAISRPALDGQGLLLVPVIGGAHFYGPSGGGVARLAEVDLPFRSNLRSDPLAPRFDLVGPGIQALGPGAAGRPLFATEPEAFGDLRVRVHLLDPLAPQEEQRVRECWARLPGPETLSSGRTVLLDGSPALIALTGPAGKLSLFGEQRLRLFPLLEDRSRSGHPPSFVVETGANHWQLVRSFLVDADGDGRRDLVLGYWKGLKDDRVVLEAYLRQQDGTFSKKPRSTSFELPDADRSFVGFGDDLDGDGAADLMLLSAGTLSIHPGEPAGKQLVARMPRTAIALGEDYPSGALTGMSLSVDGVRAWAGSLSGRPRPVDLDGDGLPEILLAWNAEKAGRVTLIRRDLPASSARRGDRGTPSARR